MKRSLSPSTNSTTAEPANEPTHDDKNMHTPGTYLPAPADQVSPHAPDMDGPHTMHNHMTYPGLHMNSMNMAMHPMTPGIPTMPQAYHDHMGTYVSPAPTCAWRNRKSGCLTNPKPKQEIHVPVTALLLSSSLGFLLYSSFDF